MLLSIQSILTKALLNTLLGMGTVFCVLILISLIISLFVFIPVLQEKFTKKAENEVTELPKNPAPEPIADEETEEEEMDEYELIAVITAAIAASTGMSEDGFVVRSIRRSPANRWANRH